MTNDDGIPLWYIIAGSVLIAVLIVFMVNKIIRQFRFGNIRELTVLITGCDTGFGHDLAIKCLSKGMTVFATCLTKEGVDRLRQEQTGLTGLLDSFIMDVREDDSVQKAYEHVYEQLKLQNKELNAIVNNAGIIGNSFFDDFLEIDDFLEVLKVNTFGAIRVTHIFKPL
ncbi:hypothetical protein AB6A40_011150, partial [Gnathostoma spinigerum]